MIPDLGPLRTLTRLEKLVMRELGGHPDPAVLRELTFTDIAGEGNRKALSLVGMPDSVIEGITLKNVKLTGGAAGAISNAKGVRLEAVTLDGPVTFTNAEKTEAPEKK